jgi:catechol 2,3-dioxygenase-like lactoylglutathione lyase family enzyme
MKLTFVYTPVPELAPALAFYRDVLGLDEAWREGDHTVGFRLPGTEVGLMVSVDTDPAGPMYLVDDAAAWMAEHPELTPVADLMEIPDGAVVRYADPAGNPFYVFDQKGAV